MKKLATPLRSPTALRVLDSLLWLVVPVLALLTMAVLVFTVALPVFGDGTLYAQGITSEVVVEHTTPSGTTLVQDVSADFVAAESPHPDVRFGSSPVQVEVTGLAPRLVVIVAALADLTFAWIAVLVLKGITASSLKGQIFTTRNSDRLARLGKVAIAYPFVAFWVGRSWFNTVTSDADLGVSGFWSTDGVDNWEAWLGCGLLLFVLAKAFEWGVELHELEQATI